MEALEKGENVRELIKVYFDATIIFVVRNE